jgi:large subunit ribosomal protein L13
MDQKLYRHHSQYFSGLKEYNMRSLIEKDSSRVIYRAIKGMIPKNDLREQILRQKLIVHDGPYHTQYA